MFDNLSQRLSKTTAALRGKGRLSDDNVKQTVRQIRMALLEADVALPVVKDFVERVRSSAVGEEVVRSLTPGQAFTGVVHRELVRAMGGESVELELRAQPPVIVLLVGVQGVGKTTTAAKLARYLVEERGKRPLLVSADVYRPAAILQLEQLATQIGVPFWSASASQLPVDIVDEAVQEARRTGIDVVIVDSAGRQHVDQEMMREIAELQASIAPVETLFIVDSMAGQDAVNSARAFGDTVPLTGVILTKVDGDARGGAALSVREVTGAPIKFIGVGEKIDALERFHPDRMASRLLGMGDVVTLVEEVEQQVDRESAEKLARKIKSGRGFDFLDLRDQLSQMLGMGGMAALLEKMPVGSVPPGAARTMGDDSSVRRQIAIIDSMTPRERRFPKLIDGSRKRRIAAGSGTQIQDVNRLLKQFTQMQKVMKKMSRGGMGRMLRGLQGMRPR